MRKFLKILPQYLVPQRALTRFGGWLANCKYPPLKNYLIRYFLNRYAVNMHEAIVTNPYDYKSFNHFFTRQLKPILRPIAPAPSIACPVDGSVSQISV
jgi:phosphatidylserine decarboxylase